MRIAMSLNVFWGRDIPIEEQIAICARAGFEALDFNLTDYQRMENPPFMGPNGDQWAYDVRKAAESNGLVFSQLHAPIYKKFVDTPEQRRMTAMGFDALRVASILGVPWVVWEPDTLPGDYSASWRNEAIRQNREFFMPFAEEADRLGIGICLENCNDSGAQYAGGCSYWIGAEPDDLCELVDSFGAPNVGICWDVGHAHIQRLKQLDALHTVGSRLKMVHIQDNNAQSDQHLLPYMGTIDWCSVMKGLKSIPYQGDFTYEAHNAIHPLPPALIEPCLHYAVETARVFLSDTFASVST